VKNHNPIGVSPKAWFRPALDRQISALDGKVIDRPIIFRRLFAQRGNQEAGRVNFLASIAIAVASPATDAKCGDPAAKTVSPQPRQSM